MLTLTKFDGAALYVLPPGIAEVRPGAFGEHGGGSRLYLASGDVVPVREDADAIEAMLAEAGLSDFDRPEAPRDLSCLSDPEEARAPPREVPTITRAMIEAATAELLTVEAVWRHVGAVEGLAERVVRRALLAQVPRAYASVREAAAAYAADIKSTD